MEQQVGFRKTRALFVLGIIVAIVVSFGLGYFSASLTIRPLAPTGPTLVDDAGRVVSIPLEVTRIVTLAPSTTELAFAIGLGPRVVCVADFSDYPPEVTNDTQYPKIGTWPSVNLEVLSACDPDLVLEAGIQPASDIERMEAVGFVVFVLDAKSVAGVLQDVRLLGLATGRRAEALAVADALQARIDVVVSKTSNATLTPYFPRVYLEFFPFWTFGPGSFGNDLILLAGGRNIAGNTTTAFPQLSNEFIIVANPEVIVYTVGPYTQTTKQDIASRAGWDQIIAVKTDKIFTIDDNEVSRPGPRIVDALEDLARIVHPELFP